MEPRGPTLTEGGLPPTNGHTVIVVHRPGRYCAGLEQAHGWTFLHAELWERTSRGLLRDFKTDIDAAFALHGGPWLVLATSPHGGDFEKHRKFVEMIGFEFVTIMPLTYGGQVPLYVRKA